MAAVPAHATLYLAGPRSATIYLDGKEVGRYQLNLDFPMGIRVYECDVTGVLQAGRNVLAVEAARGPAAAMVVPAARAIQALPPSPSTAPTSSRRTTIFTW